MDCADKWKRSTDGSGGVYMVMRRLHLIRFISVLGVWFFGLQALVGVLAAEDD